MQRISSKVAGSFTLGQVLDMAEKLDVPEQATLPVYSEGIKAVMDIGQYCRDVRLGKKTWGKKYFRYYLPSASGTAGPLLSQHVSGSEVSKLGGEGKTRNYKHYIRVAHEGPLESLEQRLMEQDDQ